MWSPMHAIRGLIWYHLQVIARIVLVLRLVPFMCGAIARWHCLAEGAAPYFQNDGEQQGAEGDDHRDGSLIHIGQTRCCGDRRHSAS